MDIKKVLEIFDAEIHKYGFKKKGKLFYRTINEITQLIGIEKSSWEKSFSIDVGIYLPDLEEVGSDNKTPKNMAYCHLYRTITALIDDIEYRKKIIYDYYKFDNISEDKLAENIKLLFKVFMEIKLFELLESLSSMEKILEYLEKDKHVYLLQTRNITKEDFILKIEGLMRFRLQ